VCRTSVRRPAERKLQERGSSPAAPSPFALRSPLALINTKALATSATEAAMNEPAQRIVETGTIRLNIAEQGDGPVVLLCHGFPESWYSWRHQLRVLAAAGFHAVAPDMRGYGKSDRPEAIEQYTIFHLVGDMVGLLDALSAATAVIVGHDWGASVAWQAALLRPDRFRAVAALSVPFRPRGKTPPTSTMPRTADAEFYQLYFQRPGAAEAEFERDVRSAIRNMLYIGSGDAPRGTGGGAGIGMVPHGGSFLRGSGAPATLPAWLSEHDVDFYAGEFARTGFRGGLNWYRNIDRNWELMAPFAGAQIKVPALYIAGDRDLVVSFPGMDQLLANFKHIVPTLQKVVMLPGCGHWTQQERPDEVNAALLDFLRSLPG
jgi:pimeloyl-ACP methyl ester carboxylesterase